MWVSICVYICCIAILFAIWKSWSSCSYVLILLFWWCTHNICSVESSFLGVLSSGGIVGSSYVIVSAANWAMTCVSGNGPEYGLGFWYQLVSGEISIVMVCESFSAARRAQCMACCKSIELWGWAYPTPFHLWSNAFPRDPNILSRVKGE